MSEKLSSGTINSTQKKQNKNELLVTYDVYGIYTIMEFRESLHSTQIAYPADNSNLDFEVLI